MVNSSEKRPLFSWMGTSSNFPLAIHLVSPTIFPFDNIGTWSPFLAFTCVHTWKEHQEKLTLFEPTPPLRPARKVLSSITLKLFLR